MQRGRGLPAHPSLPVPPHQQPQYLAGASYAQPQYHYNMSSHYAQAYMQPNPVASTSYWPQTTPEGYTLSSTHVDRAAASYPSLISMQSQMSSAWYQPGNCRCTKQGCSFVGSQKAVETHMMDRHLIYPSGWEKRKRKTDWDTDPSLKGKPVPIQGTSIKLDTPEAIEQWISERKKRFPTTDRVEDKRKKVEEAIARGQLPLEEGRFPQNKRRCVDTSFDNGRGRGGAYVQRGRGRGGGRDRGRGRGREWRTGRGVGGLTSHTETPGKLVDDNGPFRAPLDVKATHEGPEDNISISSSDSESDAPPEIVSSKAAPTRMRSETETGTNIDDGQASEEPRALNMELKPPKKPLPRQPKRPPHNPFNLRPALLRNLLVPEIRMTVSNLSQSIRFLVDNNFLKDVELKPGQADEKMIEVIGEGASVENTQNSRHDSRSI